MKTKREEKERIYKINYTYKDTEKVIMSEKKREIKCVNKYFYKNV